MVRLTKKFTDGLCEKNPAGLQARHESMVESGVGVVKRDIHALKSRRFRLEKMRKVRRKEREKVRTEGNAGG